MNPPSLKTDTGGRLAAIFKLQAGEARPVGLLSALYFALTMAFIFLQATTFGLFIQEFGSSKLPYAYLTIAVLGASVAYAYLRLQSKISLERLVALNLAFTLAMFGLYWLGLLSPYKHTVIFLLPLWFQTMINLANLAVWPLAGSTFDLRQAKRVFGIIGAGTWLANVIGGVIIAPVIALIGLPDLLLVAFAWVLLAAGVFAAFTLRRRLPSAATERAPRILPAVSPLKTIYAQQIIAYVVLWWISFYFVDMIFFDRAGIQFPDGGALAGFFGQLLSVTGVIALFITTFLTGRIIGRFGLNRALLVMPALVTAALGALALLGTFSPGNPLVFWLAAGAKVINLAFGFSLSQTALTLLYQPLPGSQRTRVQTLAEGIFQPLAIGVSGLLLLLFNTLLRFDAIGLAWIFLPIAVVWLWSIRNLSRGYPVALAEVLKQRVLGDQVPDFSDPASQAILEASLADSNPQAVLYALRMLGRGDAAVFQEKLQAALPNLLASPARDVRITALENAGNFGVENTAPIATHLAHAADPFEYAAAIRVLAQSSEKRARSLAIESIGHPEPVVQNAALVGLLKQDPHFAPAIVGLQALASALEETRRIQAANVINELTGSEFSGTLLRLLADDRTAVRRAAILAAPGIASAEVWEAVAEASALQDTCWTAVRVLGNGGEDALRAIIPRFSLPDQPGVLHRSLTTALGQIGGHLAIDALREQVGVQDSETRAVVFSALAQAGYHAEELGEIQAALDLEIKTAYILSAGQICFDSEPGSLMQAALEQDLAGCRERVFFLLSFVSDADSLKPAREPLLAQTRSGLAYALEILDTRIPAAVKPLVMPLFEALPPQQRVHRWLKHNNQLPELSTPLIWLQTVLTPDTAALYSRWLCATCLYTASQLQLLDCLESMRKYQDSDDRLLRETAAWSTARFETEIGKGEQMLSTIEKVIILKSVDLFQQTTDHILAELGTLLDETHAEEGEFIIEQGELGESMYIIVDGSVRVIDGEHILNTLGQGEVFGEMALLDPEPRMASIVACEPTHLLRLDQAAFLELLQESPEFARGILRMLTRRLRDLVQNLDQVAAPSSTQ